MNMWSFVRIFVFGLVSTLVGMLLARVFVPSTGLAAGCALYLGLFLMWSTKQCFDAEGVIAGLIREIVRREAVIVGYRLGIAQPEKLDVRHGGLS